eukprot:Nitzschia sp. Nitz4//scaffold61_size107673//70290//71348//NITZ4_004245-RA/size107673-processed-gene-0.165-mRNA-1//1//CDS//3329555740//4015//frame0
MGDRQPIRDRALVLRILVPGLETRLRDKMKEMEDQQAATVTPAKVSSEPHTKETLLELDGVTCEPTQEGSTLWNFHCDGATYPARLVNLPNPVELHKTHDHAMYYKSADIAQMLIVYEDSMALDEADAIPKTEGYPTYYHSGLTPPMRRVVERRFALREHAPIPPPRAEVSDVEAELHNLMVKISKEPGKRNKVPSLASAHHANKVLEEVVEEIVDYEPWMDDYGAQPSGIEIDAGDQLAALHPEIWLPPDIIHRLKLEEQEKEEEVLKKKLAASEKKEKKKKKKAAAAAEVASTTVSKKKGIAKKRPEEPVDEVTQAALEMTTGDLMEQVLDEDDPLDFGFDLDNMDDIMS